MKEQTMKKLITLIMTFLLCLGSVAPTFAADKKKDLMPQPSMLLLSKQLPVRFYNEKECDYPYWDWLYYQTSNSLYGL